MNKDALLKVLAEFLLDELEKDADGVEDWLAQGAEDIDEVLSAAKEFYPSDRWPSSIVESKIKRMHDDAKKYVGAFPYNGGSNVVQGDGHFAKNCQNVYGKEEWRDAVAIIAIAWANHVKDFEISYTTD